MFDKKSKKIGNVGVCNGLRNIFEEKIDDFWKRSLKVPFSVDKNTEIRRDSGAELC